MALWDDLLAEVASLTKRPDLSTYAALALRQAVRTAHKAGKYWRDLQSAPVTLVPAVVQDLDLVVNTIRFRQTAYLRVNGSDLYLDPVTINDLLDNDKIARTNVYWGFGTVLKIRAESPIDQYELAYYQYPDINPVTFNSWIADQYRDLIILWTAMTVLGSVGESEIRNTLQPLAAIALADLQQDNVEVVGR